MSQCADPRSIAQWPGAPRVDPCLPSPSHSHRSAAAPPTADHDRGAVSHWRHRGLRHTSIRCVAQGRRGARDAGAIQRGSGALSGCIALGCSRSRLLCDGAFVLSPASQAESGCVPRVLQRAVLHKHSETGSHCHHQTRSAASERTTQQEGSARSPAFLLLAQALTVCLFVVCVFAAAWHNDVVVGGICCRFEAVAAVASASAEATEEKNNKVEALESTGSQAAQSRIYIMTLGVLAPYRTRGIGRDPANAQRRTIDRKGAPFWLIARVSCCSCCVLCVGAKLLRQITEYAESHSDIADVFLHVRLHCAAHQHIALAATAARRSRCKLRASSMRAAGGDTPCR